MYYEVFLLNNLMEAPSYGYILKKKLIKDLEICTSISSNTIYSILRKYERLGVVTKKIEILENKPPRYIYTITAYGRKYFVNLLRDFPESLITDRDEFCTRLSFFSFLDKHARIRLLDLREKHLEFTKKCLEEYSGLNHFNQEQSVFKDFNMSIVNAEEKLIDFFRGKLDAPCIIDSDRNFD